MTAAQALMKDLPRPKTTAEWFSPEGAVHRASGMQISDDGHGNALLSFPDGDSITVVGIAPEDLTLRDALAAISIGLPDRPNPSEPEDAATQDNPLDLTQARAKRRRLTHF